MRLFNLVQRVKYSLRRAFYKPVVGITPNMDVKMLSEMCEEVHVFRATDGGLYWYYFPASAENMSVIEYLLNRNGVMPTFRMSRNFAGFGNFRPAFRLSQKYLVRHPVVNDFVAKIQERSIYNDEAAVIQQQIEKIRNQMGARQK